MIEPVGYLIVGLFAIGMALSFFVADPHSPTSRALALFLGLFGAAMLMNIPAYAHLLDHAVRAMDMALQVRDRMGAILSRWRKLGLELGIGVGVASGFVTVGVIGGSEHLEYTAVGPAVNLAARLCGRAEAGQVLADARVAGLAGDAGHGYRLEKLENAELKGFARPVTVFAVA